MGSERVVVVKSIDDAMPCGKWDAYEINPTTGATAAPNIVQYTARRCWLHGVVNGSTYPSVIHPSSLLLPKDAVYQD